jgi:hypothetical protein
MTEEKRDQPYHSVCKLCTLEFHHGDDASDYNNHVTGCTGTPSRSEATASELQADLETQHETRHRRKHES